MIVKANLSPVRVVVYVWRPMLYATAVALLAVVLVEGVGWRALVLPFAPVAVLGSAMAIFVAFRNNAGFNRWWDARTGWQAVQNASRIFARHLITFTDDSVRSGRVDHNQAAAYATELVTRQIAFAHLLRHRLRRTIVGEDLDHLLASDEIDRLTRSVNPPAALLMTQGARIRDGIRDGFLGQFDPISIEPNFGQFSIQQGLLERIKDTPTPRQYEYFTRIFVLLFATVLPFGLLSLGISWTAIPVSIVLAGVFVVMATVGTANENPFENRVTDVPISAICTGIERELQEALGGPVIPPPDAVDGYLW